MPSSGNEIYEFSEFRVDVSERLLYRNGKRVRLPDKPFDVLCVLVRDSGHLVGKNELLSKVWGETIVEENNLDKSISLLRNVLGHREGKQKFIETIRGHGYRFVDEARKVARNASLNAEHAVEEYSEVPARALYRPAMGPGHSANSKNVFALADWHSRDEREREFDQERPYVVPDQPLINEPPATPFVERAQGRAKRQKLVYLVFTLLMIAIGSYLLLFLAPDSRMSSVAVLPFVNASEDPNVEYLAEGITESIINNLSRLPDMKVMSRNSAFHFKDDQADTRKIASQLGISGIITGDIKQHGDKLVINVRLVRTDDDTQVWGEKYVRVAADVITLQNEIALDISRSLGAKLSGAEQKTLARKYTDNPEAYQAYLKGRYHAEKFRSPDARKALEYFQQAVTIDPNFAAAYANIAGIYVAVAGAKDFPRKETVAKGKELALKAIVLDDQLSTGHEVYGALLSRFDYNFIEGERQLKRALELDPSDASARETYSGLLTVLGNHEQALREVKLASEINPLSASVSGSVGNALLWARRYDEAVEQFQKALELDPYLTQTHYGLAMAYQMQQNYAASVESRARIREILNDNEAAALIRESFASGSWQGFLHEMVTNERAPQRPPYLKATFFLERGEKERALAMLNELVDEGSSSVIFLKVDPRFDPLREDPRFADILKRVNLE